MTKGVIFPLKNIKSKLEGVKSIEEIGFLLPRIEFGANKIVYIDGSAGVVEYNESIIRLDCDGLMLKFSGDELTVKSMENDQIIICGNILGLEFYT